jgi:hypothetical protein
LAPLDPAADEVWITRIFWEFCARTPIAKTFHIEQAFRPMEIETAVVFWRRFASTWRTGESWGFEAEEGIFMSSRLRAVLAALTIWTVCCPSIVSAQGPQFLAQQPTPADIPSGPAVQSQADEGWPVGSNQAPVRRAAPAPMADPNFSDDPIDDTPYAGQFGGSGHTGGGDYSLPRFDNGWCDSSCAAGGPGGFGGFGPRSPIYVRGEYLGWWLKGDSTPPLVTTSPNGTVIGAAGVLGQPGTSVLYGGSGVNGGMRSGARVVAGWWLNPTSRIECEFFGLGTIQSGFNESSTGNPILARPFYNLQTGAQDSNVLAFPTTTQGSIKVQEQSSFLGAGIHATQNLSCINCCPDRQYRWDFLYGFRYLRLAENLTINSSLTSTVSPGTVFTTFDGFKTANNFYGADLGLMRERRSSRWSLTTIGRIALGFTSQVATISGNSTTTPAGGPTTNSTGGLLALPSNIGTYHRDTFTYVPQLELKLGYYVTQNLRLTVGYDLIYWSRVARPGEQISTSVNTSQANGGTLTGPAGPLFSFHESDLWIQGVSVGGELVF